MKNCQWCSNTFNPNVPYQVYCSDNCREQSTKEKTAIKYYITKRNKMIGKTKKCKQCGTSLSVYNDDVLCSTCYINPVDVAKTLKEIKGMANGKFVEDSE
jgi:ribosomal protein S27AE